MRTLAGLSSLLVPVTFFLSLNLSVACNGSDSTGSGGSASAGTAGKGSGTAGTNSTASSEPTSGTSAGSGGQSSSLGGPFRYGMNFGYVPGFSDTDMATLARGVGANGARLSFPESFFAQWGYDIAVSNNQQYQTIGIKSNVAFLSGPTRDHSSAPSSTSDSDLVFWIPNDLYQPIFNGDGTVNPGNSWAKYVEQTVTTYKDYVKVYSVWNEPDWVADYTVVDGWNTKPPQKADLPRFNGSIYDYVRMLRVSSEVAKHVDPEMKIAVGGLGYAPFLSAVLRYTDNPDGGAVSGDFPKTGADYFDVVDMHYYPIFSPGSSDAGVDGLIASRDQFQAALDGANAGPRPFIVTESGAPAMVVGSATGGVDYSKNYLLKAMITAQAKGISGIDWFILSDGSDAATSSFGSMGCYGNLTDAGSVGAASRTPTGEAYRTLGALLEGASFDPDSTTALALPDSVRGSAFVTAAGKKAIALWAHAAGTTEDGSANYDLSTSATWNSFAWDAAKNHLASTLVTPSGGKASLALTTTPIFLVQP